MGKYVIDGGKTLSGKIFISGAKNSILPILSATLLNSSISILKNVPILSDTMISIEILRSLGCEVAVDNNSITVDATNVSASSISANLIKKMRSSITFLGSLLGRLNYAEISYPGGCKLGKRPIDFHINSLKKLNIDIKEDDKIIKASSSEIRGAEISLPFPSVGATQNIMLASVCSNGITTIKGAAKEPEIVDLQDFLNKIGANVQGAGTDLIKIVGVDKLCKTVEHSIIPDRIEAGTFLCAGAITGGDLTLMNVNPLHLTSLTKILGELGCSIKEDEKSLTIKSSGILNAIEKVETAPYPLFPTDLQPQLMSVLTLCKGRSIIEENIFEARNKHILELNKMNANITGTNQKFIITGVSKLSSATVFAKDLRGGAGLILAALAAKGTSIVENSKYVLRGYENIERKLSLVGANIKYLDN